MESGADNKSRITTKQNRIAETSGIRKELNVELVEIERLEDGETEEIISQIGGEVQKAE